nr:hypothetical protein [Pirellula staleyi]
MLLQFTGYLPEVSASGFFRIASTLDIAIDELPEFGLFDLFSRRN